MEPLQRNTRLLLRPGAAGFQALCQRDQLRLKLAPENRSRSELPQELLVHRGIESVKAQVSTRVETANARRQAYGQTSRRMHRYVERDKVRRLHSSLIERLARYITTGDFCPGALEPRRGRSQAERLPAHFIGRNENDLHCPCITIGEAAVEQKLRVYWRT